MLTFFILFSFQYFCKYLYSNSWSITLTMSKKVNGGQCDADYLFNPNILKVLDFSQSSCKIKNNICAEHPGENLRVRPLHMMDFYKGYSKLMSELTVVGDVTFEQYKSRFEEMSACKETYYIIVFEDISLNKICGSGSLVIEKHLNRSVKIVNRGRVEDIVVLESHRGRQLGKLMLDTLMLLGKEVGCDEISLECKDPLIRFYNQFGFVLQKSQNYMTQRHDANGH